MASNVPDPIAEEVLDQFCDPSKPVRVGFEQVTSAAYHIKSGVLQTPCPLSHLAQLTGMDIYLKKDFLQYTGSFKERGARYSLLMLDPEARKRGVAAASAGNHAQGMAYHSKCLGVPCTVVMPIMAPIMKIQKCRMYGANVIVKGKDMTEAKSIAQQLARRDGLTYINGYDHPHILAGQGTIGLEIAEQVPDADAVVVPVGGGGLIAGIAVAVKTLLPNCKVIGVESERSPGFTSALEAGKPVYTPTSPSLADGLSVPLVGCNSFATAAPLLDLMAVVREEFIASAILRLLELEKCVVEGAGATPLGAVLQGHLNDFRGKKVVLVLSGGNIDSTMLGRCLERGLAADGRLVKFTVTLPDRPGAIAELCQLLAQLGVSVKDLSFERAWLIEDVFSMKVRGVVETNDREHALKVRDGLAAVYPDLDFMEPGGAGDLSPAFQGCTCAGRA